MNINLQLNLNIDGNRCSCGGDFKVYRETEIPQLAYQWIQQIKKDTGYRTTLIEKVIWNNEKDITEEVNKLAKASIPFDDLPF
ncbi:hypothetical protein HHO41_12255 [Bacillus sp. DNRA2]|nr:hypothetical protein [Bacillus sp. DNRA2]